MNSWCRGMSNVSFFFALQNSLSCSYHWVSIWTIFETPCSTPLYHLYAEIDRNLVSHGLILAASLIGDSDPFFAKRFFAQRQKLMNNLRQLRVDLYFRCTSILSLPSDDGQEYHPQSLRSLPDARLAHDCIGGTNWVLVRRVLSRSNTCGTGIVVRSRTSCRVATLLSNMSPWTLCLTAFHRRHLPIHSASSSKEIRTVKLNSALVQNDEGRCTWRIGVLAVFLNVRFWCSASPFDSWE